jgi:hypothetical protein
MRRKGKGNGRYLGIKLGFLATRLLLVWDKKAKYATMLRILPNSMGEFYCFLLAILLRMKS